MNDFIEAKRILADAPAAQVLDRLHREASRQSWRLGARLASQAGRWLAGRPLSWDKLAPKLMDMSLAVDPASAIFAYLVARALNARRIVEYGSSHGTSAIYFGLAVRHNGGGQVIGTEIVEEKVQRARKHVAEAGLADIVEIRQGDACDSLADVTGPVDLLHNDGFPGKMLPVTQKLAPQLRTGAVVLAGNVALFPKDHADYVAWMRDPANGFVSARMPMRMGGELSVMISGGGTAS